MAKRSTSLPNIVINIDRSSHDPIYSQLYNELRGAILAGRLVPGTRLPSTRELATELGLSRTTVLNSFDHALVLMSRRRRKLLSHFVDSRVIFETTLVQWAQTVVSAFATAGLTHIEVSLVLI
jgi:DNA-binding transcriptional regulator YhcF (GntR family)